MYEGALNILKKLENNGYAAYIVGGYPRDKYLHKESLDIDICTSAKPNEIISLFENVDIRDSKYGCIHIIMNDFSFSVTTFRRDNFYSDGRHAEEISFVDTLDEDLKRRDFIMNTLCIDKDGNYVDIYGAKNDINHKIIRSVGNSEQKFREDHLRILRAIRFSTVLDFSLDREVVTAISSCKDSVALLSLFRKKEELDKIFKSSNCMKGISLLKKFDFEKTLHLNFSGVSYCSNYLGIWAQCIMDFEYPFTKKEKKTISLLQRLLKQPPKLTYVHQYGKELCFLIDEIHSNTVYHDLYKTL